MKVLPKEDIFPALKKLFSSAESSLKISSPWIKAEVFEKLLDNKKVSVELIIRNSEIEDFLITDTEIFDIVKNTGGKIYLNPEIHSKFVIVDEKIAVIGSANITRSGLYLDGNIETAVLIDDKKEVERLLSQFEQIKESSIDIFQEIAGVVLNSVSAISSEVLLFQEIPQQTYVKIPLSRKAFLLGRIAVVKDLNDSVFSTFYSFVGRSVFAEPKKLEMVITQKDPVLRKVLLLAYLNEKNTSIKTAQLEILAEFNPEKIKEKESILKTPMTPPQAGSLVYTLKSEKEIENIMQINHAGYQMSRPVKFGKLFNSNLNAFIDLEKIYTMHMAVLGTTGSGKTTFVRRLLENLHFNDIEIYIFDLYGEYGGSIKEKHVLFFPNILFPVNFENMKELFRQYGIIFQEKSVEEKRVAAYLRKNLKPDLQITGFREKSLEDLIIEAVELTDIKGELRTELFLFLDMLRRDFKEESLRIHPEIVKKMEDSFSTGKKAVIYDFQEVEDPVTRVNIAGILMKEIFRLSKTQRGKRVIILEEAQNFAPEKGFGEIQSGSSNLSYLMARKIATEGRKFDLGLIAVTQRPANISKYVLSQLNTQAVFKLINRNDLDAVSVFFEYSKEDIFSILPFLKPGSGFITGLGVPFGILTEIKLG
ncbi:helicase HerA domain-containing protein [Persephonella sp.]